MKQEKQQRRRKIFLFSLVLSLFICLLYIYFRIGPENLVSRIGFRNGYLIAFVVSFFAGFSAFTALPFYSTLISFIAGGLHPVLLGLIAGFALSLGDIFLYYFGRKGREIISGRLDRSISRMTSYFTERNLVKYIPVFSYIYISIIPLPNDWLLLFIASIRYPQKKMNLIIILGDLSHAAIITFLTVKGIMIFE
jgi:membrane protein YqaA with SNARE-associated domain